MKRGLVLSLVALAGMATSAMAQNVQLSLNLRYTDPADPSEGGRWYLMGKTDTAFGLAGVSAYLSNIDTAGIVLGNATLNAQYPVVSNTATGSIANGGNPYNGVFGGVVNVVWGQDISATGAITPNVGRTGGPGSLATDPLKNAAWNNAALLASGTFAGGGNAGNQFNRPAFVPSGANVTDANTLQSTTLGDEALNAVTTTIVRGDSLASLGLNSNAAAGLRPADSNRDFVVNGLDLAILAANFNGTGEVWDTGDSNDDGNVNGLDLALLAANFNQTSPAPVTAIPEPASIGLLALAMGGLLARRRRG